MKKITIIAVVCCTAFFWGCNDDSTSLKKSNSSSIEVAETNTGVYAKLTATWCGSCGEWGWDLNEEIIEELGNGTIAASFYGSASSKMSNETAIRFKNDFGGKGTPSFSYNGENLTEYAESGGIYTGQSKTNIVTAAYDFNNAPVEMGVGGNVTIEGTTITLNWAVKAFAEQTGTFKVGAYILEDGVMEIQSGKTGEVAHKHVLRDNMTNDFYGVDFEGGLTAGTQTDLEPVTYEMNDSWNANNIEIIGIIWKSDNSGGYEFVNAARLN